jgi:antitoxin (DNA-binding transcriptional repressor) of toxin-antitoxin stability system
MTIKPGEIVMQISVSEFKTNCTKIIRDVANLNQTIEITKHGKTVAIVTPPASPQKIDPHEFLDCLQGTVTYAPDWQQPLGEDDWEACK